MAKITKLESKMFNDKVVELIEKYGGKETKPNGELLRNFEIPFPNNKFHIKLEPVQESVYTVFGRFETFTEKLGEMFDVTDYNTKCNTHSESLDNALFRFELILMSIKKLR